MPAVFGSPTNPKLAADGKTTYLAPVGDATMFPAGRGVSIAEVTDGTSNTILFVDASDDSAVVWTKPEDLTYDPKAPAKGLGFRYPGPHWWSSWTAQPTSSRRRSRRRRFKGCSRATAARS